jgi:hypothetical protein
VIDYSIEFVFARVAAVGFPSIRYQRSFGNPNSGEAFSLAAAHADMPGRQSRQAFSPIVSAL